MELENLSQGKVLTKEEMAAKCAEISRFIRTLGTPPKKVEPVSEEELQEARREIELFAKSKEPDVEPVTEEVV